MMERNYCFAGVELTVSIPVDRAYTDDRWLAPFRVEQVRQPHRFTFEVRPILPPPGGEEIARYPGCRVYRLPDAAVRYIGTVEQGWENAYVRAEHRGKAHTVQLKADRFPGRIGVHTVLNVLEAEHLIARRDGFVFHCSYIDVDGRAVLFTAPSETGKSTQAELWRSLRGARIINGDRAAVRLVEGTVLAEGIPFAGSSCYCENRSLPVEAIVYLRQAPQTTVTRLRGYEAFSRIWEGISVNTWDKTDMELVSRAVQQIAERIPVYCLACTPDESAVTTLEQALRKQMKL
jgi:hypothetical protein